MEENLRVKSNLLSQSANEVLKDQKIIESFSGLGKVEIVGSLKLNLMFRPDIDVLVLSSSEIERKKSVEMTKDLLENPKLQTVGFADRKNYHKANLPQGFYWEIIVPKNDEEWKIDVWYLKENDEYASKVIEAMEKYQKLLKNNPAKGEIILKIKKEYFDGVKYKNGLNSFKIYEAVLEKNISTLEDFNRTLIL